MEVPHPLQCLSSSNPAQKGRDVLVLKSRKTNPLLKIPRTLVMNISWPGMQPTVLELWGELVHCLASPGEIAWAIKEDSLEVLVQVDLVKPT